MARKVVNPFWQGKYVGATAGQNMKLNRSFDIVAKNWRGWARRFGTGAVRFGAAAGIAAQGLGPLGRIAKRVYKRVSVRPATDFKQIAGVGTMRLGKRRRGAVVPYRRRPSGLKVALRDPSRTYVQLSSTRVKRGRKLSYRRRQAKIVKTITEPVRLRYGNIQDISANFGRFYLSQEYITADSLNWALPVYAIPLFNTNQGDAADYSAQAGFGMYELCWSDAVGNKGLYWRAVNGIDPTTGVPRVSLKAVQPTDNVATKVGRKALLDWTRVKLCFWGKKKNPTTIRVRIVRPLMEEFAPENALNRTAGATGLMNTYSQPANEYWLQRIKYLLNGHMGGYGRIDRRPVFKTLQQWDVKFNPIDSAAENASSDARAHMRHLDIFNRWGRVIDYTEKQIADPTFAEIEDINRVPVASGGYTAYPTHLERQMYLIIESVETNGKTAAAGNNNPRPAPPTGTDLAASFDVVFESNFSKLEQI